MALTVCCPRWLHRAVATTVLLLFTLVILGSWVIDRKADDDTEWPHTSHLSALSSSKLGHLLPRPWKSSTSLSSSIHNDTEVLKPALMNATFVSLVRNRELGGMLHSMPQAEARFNHRYHYDWVFLNDDDFTEEFKSAVLHATPNARFGKVGKHEWSYPVDIDQDFAAKSRQEMLEKFVPYADSESYRHMCRYQSGFFYKHPLVLDPVA